MRKILLTTLPGLLVVAGCEVGPDYKPPQVTVRPDFPEAAATQPSSDVSVAKPNPVSLVEWWSTFNDPELDSLVHRAIQNNLDLQNAQSRLRQARAQRGVVGADLLPNVNTSAGYQNGRGSNNVVIPLGAFGVPAAGATPTETPLVVRAADATPQASVGASQSEPLNPLGAGGLPGVETQLYQAGFDASWEIDVFGGVHRSIEAADADTAAAIEDRRFVAVSLVAEVARNYVELRSSQRQLKIAEENLASQQQTLELTRSRRHAGFVTDLDVARQAAQVAATASTLPQLEASIRRSIHQLGILLGQDPDSLSAELESPAPIPPVPPEVPIGMPVDLLRRRPDIRRAERQVAAASARIGVATADLYPRFSLTGSFGLDSSKTKNLIEWNSRYFALNPGISWPIFDGGRIKANIQVQKELAQQAANNYQQTVLNALGDVEDALASYRTEQIRNRALVDEVAASQDAEAIARQQYEQGLVDFLSVLDAQRSLFEAQIVLAQSDGAISTDLVALYKALGGGWETPANDATQ
jgi:outer membrane protein, multidrug efflux system